MNNNEIKWDKLLKIKTTGRDDSHSDQYRYPYEPTPYCVLERLADSGYINKHNRVVDYGTGKGRVCFYMSYQTGAKTTGVEYDERLFLIVQKNQNTSVSGRKTDFEMIDARLFKVPPDADRCYFFNPFSVEVLEVVLKRIIESYYENPREILLFFYYPSDEYVSFLMTQEEFSFLDEIDCVSLFDSPDERERILIWVIGAKNT